MTNTIKVEQYCFSPFTKLSIGTSSAIQIEDSPNNDICLSLDYLLFNSPCPNFAIINQIWIGGWEMMSLLGFSAIDAYAHSSDSDNVLNSFLKKLQRKPLIASRYGGIRVIGDYTGLTPEGYKNEYTFCASFFGGVKS